MEDLNLKATRRDIFGKRNRYLRRKGTTPAHIFGHNVESQALQCDTHELKLILDHAGTTRLVNLKIEGDRQAKSVFVKEIQRNAVTRQLLHVDFYQVKKGEKIAVNVPIVLVGEAPALKMKGRLLSYGINELNLECLPEKVPPQIDVDISILEEVDQAVYVKDISLDSDITVHADPEQLVVKITEAAVVVEEEIVAEEEEAEAKVEEVVEEQASGKESGEKE